MTQLVLDPARVEGVDAVASVALLSQKTRRFGFVPAVDSLLPGDLVLYSDTDTVSRLITAAQERAGFAHEHARWSHAAVYLDDGFLVEALPLSGVNQRSIYEGIPAGLLRFRRLQNLSPIDRYRIALRALSRLGQTYSVGKVPKLSLRMAEGLWKRRTAPNEKGIVICSQIYHDSVVEITRSYLDHCPVDAAVTPAHLSCSNGLVDLDVGWRRLL